MLFPGINNNLDTTSTLLTLTKCLRNRAILSGLETPSHNKIKPIPHISPKNLGTPKTTSKCEKEKGANIKVIDIKVATITHKSETHDK